MTAFIPFQPHEKPHAKSRLEKAYKKHLSLAGYNTDKGVAHVISRLAYQQVAYLVDNASDKQKFYESLAQTEAEASQFSKSVVDRIGPNIRNSVKITTSQFKRLRKWVCCNPLTRFSFICQDVDCNEDN